jgi:hypothetical protein
MFPRWRKAAVCPPVFLLPDRPTFEMLMIPSARSPRSCFRPFVRAVRCRLLPGVGLAVALVLAVAPRAVAQNATWTNTTAGTENWQLGVNWTTGPAPSATPVAPGLDAATRADLASLAGCVEKVPCARGILEWSRTRRISQNEQSQLKESASDCAKRCRLK